VGATSTLGLDNASLLSCLDGGGEMVAVKRDISNGAKLGLNSTPTFWINGKQVPRPTIDIIEAIIESILEKKVQ
jgi:protein-disulfide isomerase